ncbi:MAG: di-trans,poly-cis-decaprenylcistransferase [Rhabdochlamydiaceae bacterium]|nr:di-trans,poly-cis-decaprenylcistransferase [Rhabdochlamydiaceae bacterium]
MKTEPISIDDLPKLDGDRIPKHIAIIMDGNRRWAKDQGLPAMVGHWHGAEALSKIVEYAALLGVKVLTVYAFSTENWKRSQDEVDSIMKLFRMYLIGQKDRMVREGVRLGTIGDTRRFPQNVKETLDDVKKATAGGDKIDLVLAVNYGARDDIRRACVSIVEDCQLGRFQKEDITEALIARYLDTAPWGDPELLIRTSGENRLSNFLLWQISYAEVYITDVLWPDFNDLELMKAVVAYQKRVRRVGC